MTILFAPSEGKRPGGDLPPISKEAFCFPRLYARRIEALTRYDRFIKTADIAALQKLFGVKKESDLKRWRVDIFQAPTTKAVRRYDGVAYEYLDYDGLSPAAQTYIDDNLVIFSNLFGPLCAKDRLPDYKLKQGESIGDFAPEKFYKTHFSEALNDYLQSRGPVVDLRAGFYEKFYKIPMPYITMKFLKKGKSVSHWAKAYRGIVLREMAKHGIKSQEDLTAMDIEGLRLIEIKKSKTKEEIVYDIDE